MKLHKITSRLLGIIGPAIFILVVTTHAEAATDGFIAFTLCAPLAIIAAAYIIVSRWDISLKSMVVVTVGYAAAFVAYQVIMGAHGYSRFFWSVAIDALIWIVIAEAALLLRVFGARHNDMA